MQKNQSAVRFPNTWVTAQGSKLPPALVKEIRNGRLGNLEDLFYEAIGEEIYDDLSENGDGEEKSAARSWKN